MTCGLTTCATPAPPLPMTRPAPAGSPLRALLRRLLSWQSRARSRRALARLDADRLRDMGLGVEDAAREAAKPFWEE